MICSVAVAKCWTYQDGVSRTQENKKISGDSVAFAFGKVDGIQAGKDSVGIADFSVG